MADSLNSDAKNELAGSVTSLGSKWRHVDAHGGTTTSDQIDPALFTLLKEAALHKDPDVSKRALSTALLGGTSPEDLADYYIPALARDMGDLWCVDQLSFASVTIGASRLQAMMRALGPNWASDSAPNSGDSAILLLVPREVYHTLGSIVLSSQLRRKGISVKLLLGGKPEDIAHQVSRSIFQAVFVSASCAETLEALRRIIDTVKTSAKTPLPVVVGGSILDVETVDDVTALTGADYATRIPDEALRFCGLLENTVTMLHARDRT